MHYIYAYYREYYTGMVKDMNFIYETYRERDSGSLPL